MSFVEARQPDVQSDQRRSGRLVVAIPVEFRTASGTRQCDMSNISDKGAKLETSSPPPVGVSGMLNLGDEDIYCTVIWSNEKACGVEFEHKVQEGTLSNMPVEEARKSGPVASCNNIKMGRKRSALVSS